MSGYVIAKTSKIEGQKKNGFRHLFSFCFLEILADLSLINHLLSTIKHMEHIFVCELSSNMSNMSVNSISNFVGELSLKYVGELSCR